MKRMLLLILLSFTCVSVAGVVLLRRTNSSTIANQSTETPSQTATVTIFPTETATPTLAPTNMPTQTLTPSATSTLATPVLKITAINPDVTLLPADSSADITPTPMPTLNVPTPIAA